jgi:hypothetical protein
MTSTVERRIRKLEAHHKPEGSSMVVLGIPGRPDPTPEEIAQASLVLRVTFIAAKDGCPVEGGADASR